MKSLQGGSQGHPERVLGALGSVLGGPWGLPGRSQATFWVPRSDPDDKGARSGGLGGVSEGRKIAREPFFEIPGGQMCVFPTF